MSDIIRASLEGIRDFTDVDASVGNPIITPSGVTVIPISRITVGFATGGLDFAKKKKEPDKSFGGGGGTGVSISPIAFLTVTKDGSVTLIPLSDSLSPLDRTISLIEHSPEIIEKIKGVLS
jgi:sporulation protein YtfJ